MAMCALKRLAALANRKQTRKARPLRENRGGLQSCCSGAERIVVFLLSDTVALQPGVHNMLFVRVTFLTVLKSFNVPYTELTYPVGSLADILQVTSSVGTDHALFRMFLVYFRPMRCFVIMH
jgi:hypothetical protein